MAGTYTPGQMFDHELNQKKGWPSQYAIDYSAPYAEGQEGVKAGMVVSLNADGKFERGLTSDGAVAIFALQNQSDFDVRSAIGNTAGGNGSGLVALGAYELQSTEFVETSYAPNTPLTVHMGAPDDPDNGKLEPGTLYDDPIVGVVSSGQEDSEHHKDIQFLGFWPTWLPPTPNNGD